MNNFIQDTENDVHMYANIQYMNMQSFVNKHFKI
jgi:hypothetical protein